MGGKPSIVVSVAGALVRWLTRRARSARSRRPDWSPTRRSRSRRRPRPGGRGRVSGWRALPAATGKRQHGGRRTLPRWSTGCGRTRPRRHARGRSTTRSAPAYRAGEGEGSGAVRGGQAGHGQHGQAPPPAVGGNGMAGLVDRRAARRVRPASRADDRVVDAMRQAIGEATDASSQTTGFVTWRTREILAEAAYDGPVPSDRNVLPSVRHAVGRQARDRDRLPPAGRWLAVRRAWCAPAVVGDPLPAPAWTVLVLLDDGVPGRVGLTGMIDVATRVVRPRCCARRSRWSAGACCWLAP